MSEHTTEDVRDAHEIRHSKDEVRHYSADGTLYAYSEDGEHVVVSQGKEPATKWAKRVPATRTAVTTGEHLWTIPENWMQLLSISGAGAAQHAIYNIPETDVDVWVTVPHKNHLVDAWYGVKAVGDLRVEYADSVDWDAIDQSIQVLEDMEDADESVIAALEEVLHMKEPLEGKIAEEVEMAAKEAVLEPDQHSVPRLNGWRTEPWVDNWNFTQAVSHVTGITGDTLDDLMRELAHDSALPTYPEVEPGVKDGVGVPEGFHMRALVQAGCTAAEALDYRMVEQLDMTQTEWANESGRAQPSVSSNVSKAKRKLKN